MLAAIQLSRLAGLTAYVVRLENRVFEHWLPAQGKSRRCIRTIETSEAVNCLYACWLTVLKLSLEISDLIRFTLNRIAEDYSSEIYKIPRNDSRSQNFTPSNRSFKIGKATKSRLLPPKRASNLPPTRSQASGPLHREGPWLIGLHPKWKGCRES